MQPSQTLFARFRKLRLTTKDVNKGFYKGNRTGRMGTHTKFGKYKVDYALVRTYVVPDLRGFQLTPFVNRSIKKKWREYGPEGPQSTKLFLDNWKKYNGVD